MKKSLFLFYLCFLGIIGCSQKETAPKSYLEITNKQQIDSINQTFIDREAFPFIYTSLEDSNETALEGLFTIHGPKWNIKTRNG